MIQNNHGSQGLIATGGLILFSFIVIASGCAGAGAGAGAAASSRTEVPRFAGMWEGGFDAGMYVGDMRLVLDYEDNAYKGVLQFDIEGESMSSDIFNFESEGSTFSFWTTVEEIDVFYKGMIEGEKLTGILEAYAGSEVMAEGTFFLIKKK